MNMSEWKVNDIVIHKRDGVCKIKELKTMNLTGDGERPYFVLVPVYDQGTKIYVPADQDSTTLRKPLSVEAINELIEDLPNAGIRWIENEKARQRAYTQVLDHGQTGEILQVVTALHKKRSSRIKAGRKFHTSDERLLNDAERMLHGEFAFMLNIKPDDVPAYIVQHLESVKA
jgi:CarD family transcriptional regulator